MDQAEEHKDPAAIVHGAVAPVDMALFHAWLLAGGPNAAVQPVPPPAFVAPGPPAVYVAPGFPPGVAGPAPAPPLVPGPEAMPAWLPGMVANMTAQIAGVVNNAATGGFVVFNNEPMGKIHGLLSAVQATAPGTHLCFPLGREGVNACICCSPASRWFSL
jgi:hypothetical protein